MTKTQKNIVEIKTKGSSFHTPSFICYYKQYNDKTIYFSLGRKIGNSVLRNRIKRLIRFPLYNMKEDFRFFFIIKKLKTYDENLLKLSINLFVKSITVKLPLS